jgi:peroxiredoxin
MKFVFSALFVFISTIAIAQHPVGLAVGSAAPDFTLNDQLGKSFQLKKTNREKTVVLIFYRGQWCPYCSKQIKGLEDSMQLIVEKGATVVAITPEIAANVQKTIEKTKASFPILTDDGLKVMNAYKVAFEVDEKTIERYKRFNIDFNEANGSNGTNLPVPAVYIVKNGKIVWRYFDADYRKRPSVQEIATHL